MTDFYFCDVKPYQAPDSIKGGSVDDEIKLTECGHKLIYNMYDRLLVEFPQFVTKTVLGQAFSNDINSYTIKNHSLENFSDIPYKPFKLIVLTSIHGYEQGSAYTAALFFEEMLRSNDEKLKFIQRNVQFEIIPVLNPWGFDRNDRKNGNSVDLNRNFEQGFTGIKDKESEIYSGTEPFSEVETRIIREFVEKHSDAQAVLDYHNIYGGYPLFYVYQEKDIQLANAVFSLLSPYWQEKYDAFPKDRLLGLVRPNGNSGMLADFLLSKNMWVLTMETPWCMPEVGKKQYDAPTISCALEFFANTVYTIANKR